MTVHTKLLEKFSQLNSFPYHHLQKLDKIVAIFNTVICFIKDKSTTPLSVNYFPFMLSYQKEFIYPLLSEEEVFAVINDCHETDFFNEMKERLLNQFNFVLKHYELYRCKLDVKEIEEAAGALVEKKDHKYIFQEMEFSLTPFVGFRYNRGPVQTLFHTIKLSYYGYEKEFVYSKTVMADILKFISKNKEKIQKKLEDKKQKANLTKEKNQTIKDLHAMALTKGVRLTVTHQTVNFSFKKNNQINEEQFLRELGEFIERNFQK